MTIGTDIIEISRIKEMIEKYSDSALEKIYTKKEIEYCESKKINKYKHYAVRFSAKESMLKALGTGLLGGINWKDIEIVREGHNAPQIRLHGKAKEIADKQGIKQIVLSMSHCNEYATATIICD